MVRITKRFSTDFTRMLLNSFVEDIYKVKRGKYLFGVNSRSSTKYVLGVNGSYNFRASLLDNTPDYWVHYPKEMIAGLTYVAT